MDNDVIQPFAEAAELGEFVRVLQEKIENFQKNNLPLDEYFENEDVCAIKEMVVDCARYLIPLMSLRYREINKNLLLDLFSVPGVLSRLEANFILSDDGFSEKLVSRVWDFMETYADLDQMSSILKAETNAGVFAYHKTVSPKLFALVSTGTFLQPSSQSSDAYAGSFAFSIEDKIDILKTCGTAGGLCCGSQADARWVWEFIKNLEDSEQQVGILSAKTSVSALLHMGFVSEVWEQMVGYSPDQQVRILTSEGVVENFIRAGYGGKLKAHIYDRRFMSEEQCDQILEAHWLLRGEASGRSAEDTFYISLNVYECNQS